MLKYLGRKVLQFVLMLLALSALVFFGLKATGIDPITNQMTAATYNPERVAYMRAYYHMDEPVILQYFYWLGNMLKGDFGISIAHNWSISEMFGIKLGATLELCFTSWLVSAFLGLLIGVVCAAWQNGPLDNLFRFTAVFSQTMPSFFLGMLLLYAFAIKLGWLPASGRTSADLGDVVIFKRLKWLVLPLFAQAIGMIGNVLRYTRNTMLDMGGREFVKTARMKGISEWKVYIKHILRCAMTPVMTLIIFRLAGIIGGSVAIETIFGWPGIGVVITSAVTTNDFPVVMVSSIMVGFVVLCSSFLCDVFTALIDPRVRLDV